MNAIPGKQVNARGYRRLPIGQLHIAFPACNLGQRFVDPGCPSARCLHVYKNDKGAFAHYVENGVDSVGRDRTISTEAENEHGAQAARFSYRGKNIRSLSHLSGDNCVDRDPWERLLQFWRRSEHDRIADSQNTFA